MSLFPPSRPARIFAQRLDVVMSMVRANACVHGLAGAPLTLMLFGSQIVSRLGVITDMSVGPPWNGLPLSMSAPRIERMLAEDAVTDVAVGRTISDVPGFVVGGGPGSSTITHPLAALPATAGQRSRTSLTPSPSE